MRTHQKKNKWILLHLLHCLLNTEFLVFHLLSRVLYVESFRPTDGLYFWRPTNLFSQQIFPVAMPSLHKVQETNVCRRDAARPSVFDTFQFIRLNVQGASTKHQKLWGKKLDFFHIGPVLPRILHETRNRAQSILTLTNSRHICK